MPRERKEPKLKVGGRARIIESGWGHGFPIGSFVTVLKIFAHVNATITDSLAVECKHAERSYSQTIPSCCLKPVR